MKLSKELTKVTPVSKYLAIIAFITLPIVGFFLGTNYQKMSNPKSYQYQNTPSITEQTTVMPADETANWKTYTNQEIGISFKYPAEWKELQEKEELCLLINGSSREYNNKPCVHVRLSASDISDKPFADKPFLAVQSPLFIQHGPGRGAYWGDMFSMDAKRNGTTPEEFVNNYCIGKISDQCNKQINPNGISYIKSLENERSPESKRKAIYYAILGQNKDFPVIIFSNQVFLDTLTLKDSEKILDQILSTFKFIDSTADYFEVKELGIKFETTADIKDLTYHIKGNSAWFSTRSLAVYNSNYCSDAHAPIGLYSKIYKSGLVDDPNAYWTTTKKGLKNATIDQTNNPVQAKEFPDFYILYQHPQGTCSENKSAQALESQQLNALREAILTVELTK